MVWNKAVATFSKSPHALFPELPALEGAEGAKNAITTGRLLGLAQGLTIGIGILCFCAWIGLTLGALLRMEIGCLPGMAIGIGFWLLEIVLQLCLEKRQPQDKSVSSVITMLRKRAAAGTHGKRPSTIFRTAWLTERGIFTLGSEYFPWDRYETFSVEEIRPRLHRITFWRTATFSLAELLDGTRNLLLSWAGIAVELMVGIGGLQTYGLRNDSLAALFLGCLMLILEGTSLNAKLSRWKRSSCSRRVAALTLLVDANAVSRVEINDLLRKHLAEEL